MNFETLEKLITSLYSFIKEESEHTRSEFKLSQLKLQRIEDQLDKIEIVVAGHEGRISRLETKPA